MFGNIILRDSFRAQHLNAPLLSERLEYLKFCADKGLSRNSLKKIAEYLLVIADYLSLDKVKRGDLVVMEDVIKASKQWADRQPKHRKEQGYSAFGERTFKRIAKEWLMKIGFLEDLPEDRYPIFNTLYKYRHIRIKYMEAPLLNERLMYLEYCKKHGYPMSTLFKISSCMLMTIKYLNLNKLRFITMREISEAANAWELNEKKTKKIKRKKFHYTRKKFIRISVKWLKMAGCLKEEERVVIPYQNLLDEYVEYIRERGLEKTTIHVWTLKVRNFLSMVYESGHSVETCTPVIIDELLTKKYRMFNYKRISIKNYSTAVRSFLRYAEIRRWCNSGLFRTVELPRIYNLESLPSHLERDDVKRLLENTDTAKASGIRDYAILLLLSVYGLRSSEAVHLKLKDIDWDRERLYLKRAKNGKAQVFPLVESVGNAIIRYIKNVRPNICGLPELFICMRGHYRPLLPGSIHTLVHKRLKLLNLNILHNGAHALRHSCATSLINDGFTLKQISDYLGHSQLDSTLIYTKVDMSNLRKVADMDWSAIL
jgi:site-specific recombinase XerD